MLIPKDFGVVKQRMVPAKVAQSAKTQKTIRSDLLNLTVGVSHRPKSQIVKKIAMAMALELFEWLLGPKTSKSWKSIIFVSSGFSLSVDISGFKRKKLPINPS